MNIKIREAFQDELKTLLNLYKHLHADDVPLPEDAILQQVWAEILNDPKVHCLVADVSGKVVASCVLVVVPNLTRGARPYGLIENVVTHADYRRKGIATQLLHHALPSRSPTLEACNCDVDASPVHSEHYPCCGR